MMYVQRNVPDWYKRIIITGDRHFEDRELLFEVCDKVTRKFWKVDVLNRGPMPGVETIAEDWGHRWWHLITQFHPTSDKPAHLEEAIREMYDHATHCIVFTDGKDEESEALIRLAKLFKLKLKIVRY